MIRFAASASLLCVIASLPLHAQTWSTDDLDTGVGKIIVSPLDDSESGFIEGTNEPGTYFDSGDAVGKFVEAPNASNGGLSLEDLQTLDPSGFQRELNDITTETQERVASGNGATVRVLDKLTGKVTDMKIATGATEAWERISVTLGDCRYPEGNPAGDAYTFLEVHVVEVEAPVFQGWMIASSPALNAMDHQRYDIWPLACSTS